MMSGDVASALRMKLGALNVVDGSRTPFGADLAAYPATYDEAVECVALARRAGLKVFCAGGGGYVDSLSPLPRGSMVLSSQRLNRIVQHQPENLVVTAEAGVTLHTLQALLRRHRQFLPLNPPDADTATLGGIVAAAATGSWRATFGPVRDWLLEVRGVDGLARRIRGGARVVKNVAGYDLPKLYTGSRGTLAFLTEITFKVRPLPEQSTRLLFSAASWEALHHRLVALAASDVRATVIEVVRPDIRGTDRPSAIISLEGGAETVQWQTSAATDVLRGEGAVIGRVDAPPVLLRGLNVEIDVRVRPADTMAVVDHLVSIGWRGAAAYYPAEGRVHLRCTAYPDTPEQVDRLRCFAEARAGALTLERMPRAWIGEVHPFGAPRPDTSLGEAIKARLDPDRVFPALFLS